MLFKISRWMISYPSMLKSYKSHYLGNKLQDPPVAKFFPTSEELKLRSQLTWRWNTRHLQSAFNHSRAKMEAEGRPNRRTGGNTLVSNRHLIFLKKQKRLSSPWKSAIKKRWVGTRRSFEQRLPFPDFSGQACPRGRDLGANPQALPTLPCLPSLLREAELGTAPSTGGALQGWCQQELSLQQSFRWGNR